MKKESLTLTVTECAKLLGIGRSSAYEGVNRGEIPVIKVGKRLLVPKIALEKMLLEPRTVSPCPRTTARVHLSRVHPKARNDGEHKEDSNE